MSYLGGRDHAIPSDHPSAQQVVAPTIMQTSGPAITDRPSIEDGGRQVTILATNNGMEQRARTGPAIHSSGSGLAVRATDVMVRSANQDGKQTGTPDAFVWGLQGVGTDPASAPAGMPPWVKWAAMAGLGLIGWRMLSKKA
jgi:hypothetical protein